MENPQGRILSIYPDAAPPYAVVEVVASLRCARCASGKGCGAGILGGNEKLRRVDAMIAPGLDVQEGDSVSIALAPNNLLRASLVVYGLPLAGAIAGSAAAWLLGAGDAGAAVLALAGAGLGMSAGRLRLRQAACLREFTPHVTGRLPVAGD